MHARNKKFDDDIDLKEIALRTPGFSGACGSAGCSGWVVPEDSARRLASCSASLAFCRRS